MSFFKKVRKTVDSINPIGKYGFVNKKEYDTVTSNYNATLRGFDKNIIETGGRPSLPLPYLDTPTGSKVPLWRLQPLRMFEMSENIGDLRAVHETIQREMFRNGVEIKPVFNHKCLVCLKIFKDKPLKSYIPLEEQGKQENGEEPLKCDACGNEDSNLFVKPDPQQRAKLQAFLDIPANNNMQKIVTIGRQYERDLDIIDYAVCAVTYTYVIKTLKEPDPETGATREAVIGSEVVNGTDGKNVSTKIDEFIRVHPVQVTMIANDEGRLGIGSDEKPKWICPDYNHRDKVLAQPFCDRCGTKAFTAIMETNTVPYGLPVASPKKQWYAKHEVIWTSGKYLPDLLYGNSVLNAVWKKVMSLYHQDEYLWKYFDKERPPKSILGIASRNYETVQAFMERQNQGARADPYMPRPILINTDNINSALQFVDLTPNFKELELTALRQELRQIISSVYGVQPVFYGEQTKAGIGNESLQVTITNRTIRGYQRFLNENFFSPVGELLGVSDWKILLVTSEEIDKLRDEQIKGTQIDNASKMYQMGFDVRLDGNGDFIFSQLPNPERQMMMGGMGANVRGGKLDKTKDTNPPGEKSTNFSGEPLMNRPSDKGGARGGSPSSGFSHSNKSISQEELSKAREILEKGVLNGWTLTNMAKKLDAETSMGKEKALDIIKFLVLNA